MTPPLSKRLIVTNGILVVLVIICLASISLINHAKSSINTSPTLVTSNNLQAPLSSTHPEYTGFETLVNQGLSSDQLVGAKYAFYQFLVSKKLSPAAIRNTVVAVRTASAQTSHIPETANNTTLFMVSVGNVGYNASVNYTVFGGVELSLSDVGGRQVFDSGLIDINTQAPPYI